MSRLSFFVATAALFCISLAAIIDKNTNDRQFVAQDLTGQFDTFVQQGSCPKTIKHSEFNALGLGAYTIPHKSITQEGVSCTDNGALNVVTKEAIEVSGNGEVLKMPPLKDVISRLESQGATYLIGFERTERQCGGTNISKDSIFIFVEEEKQINIPGLINLFPGAKYMIVYEPTSPTPCTYFSKASDRVIGRPQPVSAQKPDKKAPRSTPTNEKNEPKNASSTPDAEREVPGAPGATEEPSEGSGDVENGSQSGFGSDSEQSPEPSNEDDGSVCFPAEATVELENGITKTMDKVEIGDRVKVSDGLYSDVFMFTHKLSKVTHRFVKLETSSGKSLMLTRGHYLYVNGALSAAKTIKAGDVVELDFKSFDTVRSVYEVESRGLYNPQTVHGDIIVNGIRASTYTTTVEPFSAHSMLAPLRAVYKSLGFSSVILENGADGLANVAPKGQSIF